MEGIGSVLKSRNLISVKNGIKPEQNSLFKDMFSVTKSSFNSESAPKLLGSNVDVVHLTQQSNSDSDLMEIKSINSKYGSEEITNEVKRLFGIELDSQTDLFSMVTDGTATDHLSEDQSRRTYTSSLKDSQKSAETINLMELRNSFNDIKNIMLSNKDNSAMEPEGNWLGYIDKLTALGNSPKTQTIHEFSIKKGYEVDQKNFTNEIITAVNSPETIVEETKTVDLQELEKLFIDIKNLVQQIDDNSPTNEQADEYLRYLEQLMAKENKSIAQAMHQVTALRNDVANQKKQNKNITLGGKSHDSNAKDSQLIDFQEIGKLLIDMKDTMQQIDDNNPTKEQVDKLLRYLEQLEEIGNSSIVQVIHQLSIVDSQDQFIWNSDFNTQKAIKTESEAIHIQQEFGELWNEIKNVIQEVKGNTPTREQESKLLKFLEKWTSMEKSNSMQPIQQRLLGESDLEDQKMWNNILQVYQKRSNLQQKYSTNSSITTSDVSKWVKQALANASVENASNKSVVSESSLVNSMPMTKIEQLVIHVNASNTETEGLQKKLIEEFQNALKSSKFFSNNTGSTLVLKLRPEQLGDIMVKLTQVDGEMIAKITTTTQIAKDALEGNVQQLRHLFSPHQVVVEKQEMASFQQEQQNLRQQQSNQQSSQSNDEQQLEQYETINEEEQELDFHQILMNEKV